MIRRRSILHTLQNLPRAPFVSVIGLKWIGLPPCHKSSREATHSWGVLYQPGLAKTRLSALFMLAPARDNHAFIPSLISGHSP